MLIINNDIVSEVLTMDDVIEAQEEAFKKIPTGGAIHRPRIDMYFPCQRDDGYFRWGTMEGANDGYFAIRMKSDIIHWPKDDNGNWTEEKYCREPGTYCGVILLISTENAEPLAFINDGVLQHMRVGGGAGIGVKYLARKDSHVVGMLGSGGMARTFLEAFKSRARHPPVQGLQPHPRASRGVRRGDVEAPQHRGDRGRQPPRGGQGQRHPLILHRRHEAGLRRRLDRARHARHQPRPPRNAGRLGRQVRRGDPPGHRRSADEA